MLTIAAILLAVLVLPPGWGAAAVGSAILVDVAETVVLVRRARRRPGAVGAEALPGRECIVTTRLDPVGRVRVDGETWTARTLDGGVAEQGTMVVVERLDGLQLLVRAIA